MARKNNRDPEKENHWRGQVARQAVSSLSIRRYCRREKISESMFHWWKRELLLRDRRPQTLVAPVEVPLRFTEIVVPEGPAPAPPPPTSLCSGVIEIVLAGGQLIRVDAGFDAQALSRVLSVLAGAGPC